MKVQIFKILAVLIGGIVLSACETTSNSGTRAIGAQGSTIPKGEFDRNKAAQTRLAAGLTYLRQGNLQFAKRHLDRALELGADVGSVHFGIAYYYEQIKESKKAEKSYKRALKLEPKNPDFLNGYGSFLCNKNEFAEADVYFSKAIGNPIYANIESAYVNAGVCAKLAGNGNKAANYFRKALNRNGKLPVALIEMATVEYEKKRYDRAYNYIKRYEEVSKPTAKSLWLALRVAHFRKEKNDLSSYALKLEQLFPDSDETAEFLDNKSQWM